MKKLSLITILLLFSFIFMYAEDNIKFEKLASTVPLRKYSYDYTKHITLNKGSDEKTTHFFVAFIYSDFNNKVLRVLISYTDYEKAQNLFGKEAMKPMPQENNFIKLYEYFTKTLGDSKFYIDEFILYYDWYLDENTLELLKDFEY